MLVGQTSYSMTVLIYRLTLDEIVGSDAAGPLGLSVGFLLLPYSVVLLSPYLCNIPLLYLAAL